MKYFMLHVFKVIIVFIASMYLLDFIYNYVYSNDHPRNKVQLIANSNNQYIDYIFLGSSRVENHIDCDLIEKLTGKSCINLGLIGGKPKDLRVMASFIKTNNITYDKLFVQIDYNYNATAHSPLFIALVAPFIQKEEFPKDLKSELDNQLYGSIPFFRYAKNDEIIGFREIVMQLIKKDINVDLNNGFVPLPGCGKGISGHFPSNVIYPNKAIEEVLVMHSNNTVLFTAPYCNSSATRDLFMNELKGYYPKLQDYSRLFDEEDDLTVNCGHLNPKGAKKFTEILTRDLILN